MVKLKALMENVDNIKNMDNINREMEILRITKKC